jgi:hypothetical protein
MQSVIMMSANMINIVIIMVIVINVVMLSVEVPIKNDNPSFFILYSGKGQFLIKLINENGETFL